MGMPPASVTVTVIAQRGAYRAAPVELPVSADFSERYELGELLGSGSFGSVYRARRKRDGVSVAVKFLLRPQSEEAVARFRVEIELLSQVNNLHVVRVTEVGVMSGHPYLVCDHVDGGTLADLLARERRLPFGRAVELVLDLLKGLQGPHTRGIVHRDVKPANVLLTRSGRAVLADFGVAKPALAVTRELVGTPLYMAPEQLADGEATPVSDLYAVGVILYEALTGELPHHGNTVEEIRAAHRRDRPLPLAEKVPGLPPLLLSLVTAALSSSPADRPATAVDMIRQLKLALREAAAPPPPPAWSRSASLALPRELAGHYRPVCATAHADHDLIRARTSMVRWLPVGGKEVAIRVARGEGDQLAAAGARLAAEASVLGRLRHPGLVTALSSGNEDGETWTVFEWLPGASLRDRLAVGRLEADRAVAVVLQLLDALSALHRAGLVHANLTPAKLVGAGGARYKLVGLGRAVSSKAPLAPLHGSLWHLAPEVLVGEPPTPRSDIYAAGVILYQALTGKLPYRATVHAELLDEHDRGAFSRPSAYVHISGYLEGIVLRALSRTPDKRFPDADAMAAPLRELNL